MAKVEDRALAPAATLNDDIGEETRLRLYRIQVEIREAEQRAYREAIEQIKLGDSLGFNTIWAVEHHFREGRSHCPAPETFKAVAWSRSGRVPPIPAYIVV